MTCAFSRGTLCVRCRKARRAIDFTIYRLESLPKMRSGCCSSTAAVPPIKVAWTGVPISARLLICAALKQPLARNRVYFLLSETERKTG